MFNDGQDDIILEENDLENKEDPEPSSRDSHLEVRRRQRSQKRRHKEESRKDKDNRSASYLQVILPPWSHLP